MIKFLSLASILAVALAAPAWAQVPISALPAASTPLAGTEQVPCVQGGVTKNCTAAQLSALGVVQAPNNSFLRAAPSTAYPAIMRAGYAAAGDAPPLLFLTSGSACSLNAGTGDGGSQVPSSDGKCWIANFPNGPRDAREWGAIGNNSTDNTAAVQACWASFATTGPGASCRLPNGSGGGKYRFASQLTFTYPAQAFALGLSGDGNDATTLYWPAGGGIALTLLHPNNTVQIGDLSLTTGAVNTGTAISITQGAPESSYSLSDISRVVIRGDTIASTYWASAINTVGLSNLHIGGAQITCNVTGSTNGVGIKFSGNPAGAGGLFYAFSLAVDSLTQTNNCGAGGFIYGPYVQGVQISDANFLNSNDKYIYVPSGEAGVLAQLALSNVGFGPGVANANLIEVDTTLDAISITGSLIYIGANGCGLRFTAPSAGVQVSSTLFAGEGAGSVGVCHTAAVAANTAESYTGNGFQNLATGISAGTSVSAGGIVPRGNTYAGTTSPIGGTLSAFNLGGSAISFSSAGSTLTQGATNYVGSAGTNTGTATLAIIPVATPGLLYGLSVQLGNTPGVGFTYSPTIFAGGASSALTCAITGAAGTCADATHSVALTGVPGTSESLWLQVPVTAGATQAVLTGSAMFATSY